MYTRGVLQISESLPGWNQEGRMVVIPGRFYNLILDGKV